jgi:hypothetical protein
LNLDTDDEVAPFVWLLALWHAQVGVAVSEGGWCGAARADADLLAVDGLYGSRPTGQGLFQCDLDVVDDVVAFAFVEWMFFL